MTLAITSWCASEKCDPCKPVPKPAYGWYCLIKQIVYRSSGVEQVIAVVTVGADGVTSGEFLPANPYPDGWMVYVVIERNSAYDSNPYYTGYSLGQFSNPNDAMAAATAVLANASPIS